MRTPPFFVFLTSLATVLRVVALSAGLSISDFRLAWELCRGKEPEVVGCVLVLPRSAWLHPTCVLHGDTTYKVQFPSGRDNGLRSFVIVMDWRLLPWRARLPRIFP